MAAQHIIFLAPRSFAVEKDIIHCSHSTLEVWVAGQGELRPPCETPETTYPATRRFTVKHLHVPQGEYLLIPAEETLPLRTVSPQEAGALGGRFESRLLYCADRVQKGRGNASGIHEGYVFDVFEAITLAARHNAAAPNRRARALLRDPALSGPVLVLRTRLLKNANLAQSLVLHRLPPDADLLAGGQWAQMRAEFTSCAPNSVVSMDRRTLEQQDNGAWHNVHTR